MVGNAGNACWRPSRRRSGPEKAHKFDKAVCARGGEESNRLPVVKV